MRYNITMSTREQLKAQREAEALSMTLRLVSKGFEPMYGGSKGHGFWIKGQKHSNLTKSNLNPCFFLMRDCEALLAA